MEPYAQKIAKATDEVIPAATRTLFAEAFTAAKASQAAVDAAKKAAIDARTAREAADPAWDEGYEEYHRAVEFVMKGDRTRVTTWIKEWPV